MPISPGQSFADLQSSLPYYASPAAGLPHTEAYLNTAGSVLQDMANRQKQGMRERMTLQGTGNSSLLENRLMDIDQSARNSLNQMMRHIAELRAQNEYQRQQYEAERARNINEAKQVQEKNRASSEKLGWLSTAGTALGGGLGFLAGGPMGAGLGAQIGGEALRGLGGMEYGLEPSFRGVGNAAGYIDQETKNKADRDFYLKLFGKSIDGGGGYKTPSLSLGTNASDFGKTLDLGPEDWK